MRDCEESVYYGLEEESDSDEIDQIEEHDEEASDGGDEVQ